MSEIDLKSDVTGRVWQILKAPGDVVAADEAVMIIEAMKMEIPLVAETAGKIKTLLVKEGDEVTEEQVIALMERAL